MVNFLSVATCSSLTCVKPQSLHMLKVVIKYTKATTKAKYTKATECMGCVHMMCYNGDV